MVTEVPLWIAYARGLALNRTQVLLDFIVHFTELLRKHSDSSEVTFAAELGELKAAPQSVCGEALWALEWDGQSEVNRAYERAAES